MFEQQERQKPAQHRAARIAVDTAATIRDQELYNVEIRVKNVSTSGFMAECDDPVRIGSFVALEVPGIGPVSAQVRWQLGWQMGGQFQDPISLTECEWTATRVERSAQA